jgi:CHAD domain-containing protein
MAARATHRDNISPTLRRAALRYADKALAESPHLQTDPGRAIHRVRRALKRLRAILQLVESPRPGWLDDAQRTAAAVARRLSPVRDRDVVAAALNKLGQRRRKQWAALLPPSSAVPEESAIVVGESIITNLYELRAALDRRTWPARSAVQLRDSVRRTYRTARRRRKVAKAEPTPEHLHEWRKAVVRLRFQLTAAEPLLSPRARKLQRRLAPLAKTLGQCGDLRLVARHITPASPGRRPAAPREVLQWLENRRLKLARRALRSGATHFAGRPRDFAEACRRRSGK